MGRQLNVRSDEAYEIARNVAQITGKPVAEVVLDALREHGAKFRDAAQLTATQKANIEAIRAAARRAEANMKPGVSVEDVMDEMYDEQGLPR
ncbi:type II toxin-antitoxin system VapB family antitoxin [Methylopila sp. 73B]|uniref:type II toxin-antitoxin system VapB family antitoxin n=1 Tax=Methylopila sp. 73B TaxID=1120792 RepID=UPI00037BAFEE|nr:type II toxin-antitoxin system VapB family antitoxin [Methylopila sp. 73B]